MVIFLLIAGMFALPVMFAGGLFVVAHWGPFFGIDLKLDDAQQQSPAPAEATESAPTTRPVRRAA